MPGCIAGQSLNDEVGASCRLRLAFVHRELVITLAAQHKLPAVYPGRFFAAGGGLISYGADQMAAAFRKGLGETGLLIVVLALGDAGQ
jgi:hypothetical protein